MISILGVIWGKLRAIGVVASLMNTLAKRRERKRLMEAGERRANEKRNKESRDVKKRMDAVGESSSDDVVDRLRDGGF